MIRIGIIEDNIFLLKSFRDYLNETDGMSVVFSSISMEDAKEQMDNKSIPAPDVVLLDIFLPGESGIDAIPYIKEKYPDTKIIVLTAYNEENLIINCLKQGAVGYALKTSKLSQLVDIILHTNRTGAFVDELSLSKIITNLQSKKAGSVKELLTFREKEIVGLVEKGLSYKQMSEMLFVTTYTINYHLKNIYKKLGIHSKSELLSKLMDEGKA
ncbi:MAG: response regulator [Chitinophagia bacterium]|jgi:DNA-binding NarL/FixJ family response regulator